MRQDLRKSATRRNREIQGRGDPGKQGRQGVRPQRHTDQVPRSSPVTQKGGVPVRDRQTREGVMNFFLSTKTVMP
jgi:hypothetical protein